MNVSRVGPRSLNPEGLADMHLSFHHKRHTAGPNTVDVLRKDQHFAPYDKEHLREMFRNQHVEHVEKVGRAWIYTTREGYKAQSFMPPWKVPYDTGV